MSRTHQSPPVAVEVASLAPATTTSGRATFPFKPASTLVALKNLQVELEIRSPPCSRPRSAVTESTLQRQEIFFIEIDEDSTEEISNETDSNSAVLADNIRRTTVAITGGTILSLGLVLIPFPIIPGSLIAYGGLMILATEFDSARKAMETVKEAIVKWRADEQEEEVNTAGHEEEGRRETIVHESNESGKSTENVFGAGGPANVKPMAHFLKKALLLNFEDADTNEKTDAGKSGQYASGQPELAPVSPMCHSELFGCVSLSSSSFDDDEHGDSNEKIHMTYVRFRRLGSDESISLNPLDEGNARLLSRQDTCSSHGNDSDCFWVTFGCNAFRDHEQRQRPQHSDNTHM